MASALVGTFLGIAAGLLLRKPHCHQRDIPSCIKIDFLKCVSVQHWSVCQREQPGHGRLKQLAGGVSSDFRPSADELEELLKSTK